MDGRSLNLDFGNHADTEQLRQLIQRMGEFIALYEAAEEKLRQRESILETRMTSHESYVNEQLEQIHQAVTTFENIMTEAGVARWRLAAEDALRQGQTHLKSLENSSEEFRQLSNDTCDRLERATSYAIKGVSDAVSSFRVADFKQLTQDSCDRVEQAAMGAVKNISQVSQWFYWKKSILVFTVALLVAMIMGLYINGEWPWQDHQKIMHEREVGKAAMHVWSELSRRDKRRILRDLQEKTV